MKHRHQQSGHIHLIAVFLVVVVAVAGVGYYVYARQHQPSKVTDAATRAQLQQTAAELKKLDLGSLAKSVTTVTSVQNNFDFSKANGK